MEWRDLGETGLRVPVIGLGAHASFDILNKEAQTSRSRLIRQATEKSIQLFSCSLGTGDADRVLGAALLGHREQAIVVASLSMHERREGVRAVERGLHYFDGRIEVLMIDQPRLTPIYQRLLDRLKAEGSIRAVGVRITDDVDLDQLQGAARADEIDVVGFPGSPRRSALGQDVLRIAGRFGLGTIAFSPFEGGRLARLHPPSASLAAINGVDALSWPQIVLKWILSDQRVAAVVPATHRYTHMVANAAAGDGTWFSDDERAAVLAALAQLKR